MLLTIDRRIPRGHLSKPDFTKERRQRRRTPVLLNPPLNADEQRVAKAVENGVRDARNAVKSPRLLEAIRLRSPDGIVAAVPLEPLRNIMRPIETVYRDQVVKAGNKAFAGSNSALRFAVTDKVVIDAAAQRAGQLVQNITDEQLKSLRGAIVDAVAGQYDVDDTAKIIRSSIGLTDRYRQAVSRNYDLVKGNALAQGATLRQAQDTAEKSAQRYADRLLRSRARTIAQTEIHQMNNIGKQKAWDDMFSDGTILPDTYKVWVANFGACDICMGFNGEAVPVTQPFSNGNQQPEAHPNCRCTAEFESDEEYAARTGMPLFEEVPTPPPPSAPPTPRVTPPKGRARKGMGDVLITDEQEALFAKGSAAPHLVRGDDGVLRFTEARQKLHDDYIEARIKGKPRSEKPQFHVLGGGPASGKSTMLQSGKVDIDLKRSVEVNPDDARLYLPEYDELVKAGDKGASAFTHEEASYLSKRLTQASIERGRDVVLDGTGDSSLDKLTSKVVAARKAGYEVKGYYATVPTRMAIERSNARAMKAGVNQGRFVPEEVIIETHKGVSRVFPQAAEKLFDDVVLYDTSSKVPTLIARANKGRLEVIDEAGYRAFLDKADEVFDNPLGAKLLTPKKRVLVEKPTPKRKAVIRTDDIDELSDEMNLLLEAEQRLIDFDEDDALLIQGHEVTLPLATTRKLGLDAKPQVVSVAEFDELTKDRPERVMFRGMAADVYSGKSAGDIFDQFKDRDFAQRDGMYGSGLYFALRGFDVPRGARANPSYDINYGQQLARQSYAGGTGVVMRAALKSDARIINTRDLEIEMNKIRDSFEKKIKDLETKYEAERQETIRRFGDGTPQQGAAQDALFVKLEADRRKVVRAMHASLRDPGVAARILGYDAIEVVDQNYIVVLNRGAVIVQRQADYDNGKIPRPMR